MINKSAFTEKENAFLVLYPDNLDIPDDVLDKLIPSENKEWMRTSTDKWLHYQPTGDEYCYSFELPGIKLIISGELPYEKVKTLADEFVKNLQHHYSGMKIELVTIDKTRLAGMQ